MSVMRVLKRLGIAGNRGNAMTVMRVMKRLGIAGEWTAVWKVS
jgi:hypothetical protein